MVMQEVRVNVVWLRGAALVKVDGRGSFTLEDVPAKEAYRLVGMVERWFAKEGMRADVYFTGVAGYIPAGLPGA